jgi:hypothetical protein
MWTDHTDARATMMTLLGIQDDYNWDGAATAKMVVPTDLPSTMRAALSTFEGLASAYTQLNAPFGKFGLDTLGANTTAIEGQSVNDSAYTNDDQQLAACESARTSLVAQIQSALQAAETGSVALDVTAARSLIAQANQLIGKAQTLQRATTPPKTLLCS